MEDSKQECCCRWHIVGHYRGSISLADEELLTNTKVVVETERVGVLLYCREQALMQMQQEKLVQEYQDKHAAVVVWLPT